MRVGAGVEGAADGSSVVGEREGVGVASPRQGIPVPKPQPFVGASDGTGVVGTRVGNCEGAGVLGVGVVAGEGTGVVGVVEGRGVGSRVLQTRQSVAGSQRQAEAEIARTEMRMEMRWAPSRGLLSESVSAMAMSALPMALHLARSVLRSVLPMVPTSGSVRAAMWAAASEPP
jgi:hypothetical protein